MHSKNINKAERRYLAAVKELPCGLCGASGPSDAHHIEQRLHYLCIPLCKECHQGTNGWHGNKSLWRIKKMDEMDVLNNTIHLLCGD
jgi:hypothetical protein